MFDCCCIDFEQRNPSPCPLICERPIDHLLPAKRRLLFVSSMRKAGSTSLLHGLVYPNDPYARPLPTVKPFVEHVWRRKRGGRAEEVSLVDVGRPPRIDFLSDTSDDSVSMRSSSLSSRSSLFDSVARGRISLPQACAHAAGVVFVVDASVHSEHGSLDEDQLRFAEGLLGAMRSAPQEHRKAAHTRRLMVVANKQDVAGALTPTEVALALRLHDVSDIEWMCTPEVATEPRESIDDLLRFFFPDSATYTRGPPQVRRRHYTEEEPTAEALLSR